jgi:hypothetical protein
MDEHELGRLIGMLQPAPADWTRAAQELPFVTSELDDILKRARGDDGFREALRADAGSALRERGYDLSPSVVAHIMRRLPEDDQKA